MKRAEQFAWGTLGALVVIAVILLIGGVQMQFTAFWAGMMLALGQAIVAGLAGWGMMLARQTEELHLYPPASATKVEKPTNSPFRMSVSDDTPSAPVKASAGTETVTLDTGFQRMVVGVTGVVLASLGFISAYLVYRNLMWAKGNPDKVLPVAGSNDEPLPFTELAVMMGLAAAGGYLVFYWLTRPKRRDGDWMGEAVHGSLTLGAGGMIALGVATVAAFFGKSYASETAAGILAFLMVLQGLELLVNSMRSYSSIEELDQEAVDLQATPLVPMLGSVWLMGLRELFAQSVGLAGHGQRGVFARMMPRSLLAMLVIGLGLSCVRVVEPGEVAVLERFGYADLNEKALLRPGLHFTLPWPMDELVRIPTDRLQMTDVGKGPHDTEGHGGIDFQLWVGNPGARDAVDDLVITGDQQVLETFVQVQWRVSDPVAFYVMVSHSDFYAKRADRTETRTMYAEIVRQYTMLAVTRSFATHTLEQIIMSERGNVERHCRDLLQAKLTELKSGITVDFLTIKDLHPPEGQADVETAAADLIGPSRVKRGPASAWEYVVSMREYKELLISRARGEAAAAIATAQGQAKSAILDAERYRLSKVGEAQGDADRLVKVTEGIKPEEEEFLINLMKRELYYSTTRELFSGLNKYIVDPGVNVEFIQNTNPGVPAPIRSP